MRLTAADSQLALLKPSDGKDGVASFGKDWTNLGILVAELVGAPLNRVSNLRLVPSEIAEHISATEGQLLRSMMRLETAERLDGEEICRRMGEVITAITAEAAGREVKSAVSIRLGRRSQIADTIRRASDNEIETADDQSQIEYVKADLSSEPYFARIQAKPEDEPSFVLLGQSLTYRLLAFRQPGSTDVADWEFASCDRADLDRGDRQRVPLDPDLGHRHDRAGHGVRSARLVRPSSTTSCGRDRACR
jgi:hypothetical protein